MKRPDLSKTPAARLYREKAEDIINGICPTCGVEIKQEDFRDTLSIKEYYISGLCQKCQDSVFGKGG